MACQLHASALIAYLLTSPAFALADASCADASTCASANGTALLQITNRGTKRVAGIGGHGNAANASRTHCGVLASDVDLTSEQYETEKKGCCLYGMAEFIRLVTESSQMGYTICESGFAPGLAAWHGCDGDGKDKTFQDLLDDIVRHADDPCTSIAKPGQLCKPRDPEICESFPGLRPVNCGCSRSKSLTLDFKAADLIVNDLIDGELMRFEKVGKYGSPPEDIDLEVEKMTAYSTHKPENNRIYNEFGQISLAKGRATEFKFTFMRTGTTAAVDIDEILFTIFDLDGSREEHQAVTASDFSGYVVEVGSRLKISNEGGGEFRFVGEPVVGQAGNVDFPTTPMDLNDLQRKVSLMLIYKKRSSFELTFSVVPPGDPEPNPKGGRNFLFSGKSALINHCGP